MSLFHIKSVYHDRVVFQYLTNGLHLHELDNFNLTLIVTDQRKICLFYQ
jgi:hypothetical protein